MDTNKELIALNRKITGAWKSLSYGSLWVQEKEVEYLMSGRSTELIERIKFYSKPVDIYGAVAANRDNGRYVWIYVYFDHHLWKCHNLNAAFDLAKKISAFIDGEHELKKMKCKLEVQVRSEKKKTALELVGT
jgi:hypothetical protein